jgi:hypothetical protein
MSILLWWIRQVVLILIGAFFLYYGIQLLISSYDLNDPFIFIMIFFAANFIILISGTLIFGFAYRMVMAFRQHGYGLPTIKKNRCGVTSPS